jgi:hypothetical protein
MHPVPQMACNNKKEKFGFGNYKRHPVMGAFLCRYLHKSGNHPVSFILLYLIGFSCRSIVHKKLKTIIENLYYCSQISALVAKHKR